MSIYILDTETTGLEECQPIELAYQQLNQDLTPAASLICRRYKPTKSIDFGAMATHHITEDDLKDCPPHTECKLPDDLRYMIGHNVDFDWKVMGQPSGVKRICTLALARHTFPKLDSHSLGAVMYYLAGLAARDMLQSAHNAGVDVQLCQFVLARVCTIHKIADVEALWKLSEHARVPTVMTFGKFKGQPVSAVDRGYAGWYSRQPDTDPYVLEAFKRAGKL